MIARAKLRLEDDTKGFLSGEAEASKRSALNANGAVLLKDFTSAGINHFQRCLAFPSRSRCARVRVYSTRAKHIIDINRDRETGNGHEVIFDRGMSGRIDLRISVHAIVGRLTIPRGGQAISASGICGGLCDYAVDENVSVGIDIRRHVATAIGDGFYRHGTIHLDRAVVEVAARFAWPVAVGGVADARSGGSACDC